MTTSRPSFHRTFTPKEDTLQENETLVTPHIKDDLEPARYTPKESILEVNEKPVTAQRKDSVEPDRSPKHSPRLLEPEQPHIELSIETHEITVSIPGGTALPLTLSIRSTHPLRVKTEQHLATPGQQGDEDSKSKMTSRGSPRSEENQPLSIVNSANNSVTSTQAKQIPAKRQIRGGQILISNSSVPQPRSEEVVVEGHMYPTACSNSESSDQSPTAESQLPKEDTDKEQPPVDGGDQLMPGDDYPAARSTSVQPQPQPEPPETEEAGKQIEATESHNSIPVSPKSNTPTTKADTEQPEAEPSTQPTQTLHPATVPNIHIESASDSGAATPLEGPLALTPVHVNSVNAAEHPPKTAKISSSKRTSARNFPKTLRPTMTPVKKHQKAVRRARSLILQRPVLVPLLGRELADLTGPQLKALAATGSLVTTSAVPTTAVPGLDGPADDHLDEQNASCPYKSFFNWRYNWTVARANKTLLRRCTLCNGVSLPPIYRLNKMAVKRKNPELDRHERHHEAVQLTKREKFCWRSKAFGATCDGNNDEGARRKYFREEAQRQGGFTERGYWVRAND